MSLLTVKLTLFASLSTPKTCAWTSSPTLKKFSAVSILSQESSERWMKPSKAESVSEFTETKTPKGVLLETLAEITSPGFTCEDSFEKSSSPSAAF